MAIFFFVEFFWDICRSYYNFKIFQCFDKIFFSILFFVTPCEQSFLLNFFLILILLFKLFCAIFFHQIILIRYNLLSLIMMLFVLAWNHRYFPFFLCCSFNCQCSLNVILSIVIVLFVVVFLCVLT